MRNDTPYPKCFLHFFDIHFLQECRKKFDNEKSINDELLLATKFAFFCSSSLIVPLASYFENEICQSIINRIRQEVPDYNIFFICNSNSACEFAQCKLLQYDTISHQYKIYKKIVDDGIKMDMPVRNKTTDTTGMIRSDWEKSIKEETFMYNFSSVEKILPKGFKEKCENLHSLLNGLAYTPDHINKALLGDSTSDLNLIESRISTIINKSYFSSYLSVLYPCAVVNELYYLHSIYVDSKTDPLYIPYVFIKKHLSSEGLLNRFESNFYEIFKMKNDDSFVAEFASPIKKYYACMLDLKSLTLFSNYGTVGAFGQNINNSGNITGKS